MGQAMLLHSVKILLKPILSFILLVGVFVSCASLPKGAYEKGKASWYGKKFHGRLAADGSVFNMYKMTAAHPNLPLGSTVKVVNQNNGRHVVVRITDRGPFAGGRIIDLSKAAAEKLGFVSDGVAPVVLYFLKGP